MHGKNGESATSLVFSEDETDGLDHSQSAVLRFGINEVITNTTLKNKREKSFVC